MPERTAKPIEDCAHCWFTEKPTSSPPFCFVTTTAFWGISTAFVSVPSISIQIESTTLGGACSKQSVGAIDTDGKSVGESDGEALGLTEGEALGEALGAPLGLPEGSAEGAAEGDALGELEGDPEGAELLVGVSLGADDG